MVMMCLKEFQLKTVFEMFESWYESISLMINYKKSLIFQMFKNMNLEGEKYKFSVKKHIMFLEVWITLTLNFSKQIDTIIKTLEI